MPQPAHLPAGGIAEKVMALLHFALQPGGYLLLGTSDTIGDRETLSKP